MQTWLSTPPTPRPTATLVRPPLTSKRRCKPDRVLHLPTGEQPPNDLTMQPFLAAISAKNDQQPLQNFLRFLLRRFQKPW